MMSQKIVFAVAIIITIGRFAAIGYGESVISIEVADNAAPAVGEQLIVNVNITEGAGVAGYGMLMAFDASVLKYIGASNGDYLPTPGIWIAPIRTDDGSYKLEYKIGDSTGLGETVSLGLDAISVDDMFFNLSELDAEDAESPLPEGDYWGITPLASAAPEVAPADDGTLITFTFEVLAETKPAAIWLVDVHPSDVNDEPLAFTVENDRITVHADSVAATDVNADGAVNILDLVFVAARFGEPVTDANKAADVNGDKVINILDLVLIAKDFGD